MIKSGLVIVAILANVLAARLTIEENVSVFIQSISKEVTKTAEDDTELK